MPAVAAPAAVSPFLRNERRFVAAFIFIHMSVHRKASLAKSLRSPWKQVSVTCSKKISAVILSKEE